MNSQIALALGIAKVIRTVVSSTFSTCIGSPPNTNLADTVGCSVSLSMNESHQNTTSSAVNGAPSDHLWPALNSSVRLRASSESAAPMAMPG